MLWLALHTLRGRRVSFAGAFLTLVFGVAMISAAGTVIAVSGDDAGTADQAARTALAEAGNLLALFAGIGGFLTIFIVASTFSFTVSQRRHELALLRMAGADPGQVRRMVLTETTVLGTTAAAAGALLGVPLASVLSGVLVWRQVLPAGIELPLTPSRLVAPLLAAFVLGLVVAVLGAWPAARRAGAIRPVEAFREAVVDTRPIPRGRRILGVLGIAAGLGLVLLLPQVPSDGQLPLALFTAQPIVVGLALLAPAFVPRLTGLVVAPLAAFTGGSGLLARENLRAAIRRTASCAAPVLVTIGITGSLLAGTDLLGAAGRASAAKLYTSQLRATGDNLDTAVPGVRAAVLLEDVTVSALVQRTSREVAAVGVTGNGVSGVLGLGTTIGDPTQLTGSTAMLGRRQAAGFDLAVGDSVRLRMPDGATVSVKVVALYDGPPLTTPLLLPEQLVAQHRTLGARPPALHVALNDPADTARVENLLAAKGYQVTLTAAWLATAAGFREDGMRIGAELLAWFALLYTLFAVANTVTMSFGERASEFRQLRLLGAQRAQVLQMVLWEGAGIALTGLALGAAAVALAVGGLWQAVRSAGLDIPLDLPWSPLLSIAAGCAVVLLAVSTVATMVVMRPSDAR
ncbi:FtsX-like permease family protein [Amycolatopsis sp. NPDC003676]